jgi:hypothetical protein
MPAVSSLSHTPFQLFLVWPAQRHLKSSMNMNEEIQQAQLQTILHLIRLTNHVIVNLVNKHL